MRHREQPDQMLQVRQLLVLALLLVQPVSWRPERLPVVLLDYRQTCSTPKCFQSIGLS
jgi:hypothetical protein